MSGQSVRGKQSDAGPSKPALKEGGGFDLIQTAQEILLPDRSHLLLQDRVGDGALLERGESAVLWGSLTDTRALSKPSSIMAPLVGKGSEKRNRTRRTNESHLKRSMRGEPKTRSTR